MNNYPQDKYVHTILLVDDREENLFSLESLLESDNRKFLKANSGNEALKLAFKFSNEISLILLDVQMPYMDGFEVAELLKGNQHTKNIPIIFVTAISKETKFVLRGLEGGAVDYLFKPLNTDITKAKVSTFLELVERRKEIISKNEMLEKLNADKNYFLGMAAHDLRNPISGILGLSEFLIDETENTLNEEQLQMLNMIQDSSRFMLNLLNDILDVQKIEAGRIEINSEDTDFKELIEKNLKVNKLLAEKKNIRIEFHCNGGKYFGKVDMVRIEQVLNNLISNAIKFSEKNKNVKVILDRDENNISVSVTDEGPGIPKEEMNKLFKPFQRTSVKATNGELTTGLGLVISKKIIEAHKGEITVDSTTGKGSTFTFKIPITKN